MKARRGPLILKVKSAAFFPDGCLMVNKPYFSCNAAAVTGHRTIFADNSMARDDNRDAVSAVCSSHRARGRWFTYLHRNRLIMRRLTEANVL